MKFYFSKKITLIGLIAVVLMLRASYWQWERYEWKVALINQLETNVAKDPLKIDQAIEDFQKEPPSAIHRRVQVSGSYDFSKEMILRNRRYQNEPGVFVITPLKIVDSDQHVLVNRGFLPLSKSKSEDRNIYQRPRDVNFIGLIKEGSEKPFLGPRDPESGKDKSWVDAWLRVDIDNIGKQLPYPIAPFYLEIMNTGDKEGVDIGKTSEQILDTRAGKEELFFLPGKSAIATGKTFEDEDLPIPLFDTVTPPGRHFGYIFEWAIMALAVIVICVGLQFRKPRGIKKEII